VQAQAIGYTADGRIGSLMSAFLCQFATIAHDEHWTLISDSAPIAAR
jgi:hypothetical protein